MQSPTFLRGSSVSNHKGLEIERKFLVKAAHKGPDDLQGDVRYIVQTYLVPSEKGVTERVRSSSDGRRVEYTHTIKRRIEAGVHEEDEKEITAEEYGALLSRADPNLNNIYKTRHTFMWGGWKWELDYFTSFTDELSGLKILEIELPDLQTPVTIPPFIEVEREVTTDPAYTNRALAER
jgi:CYTH domain-containing protein